MHPRRPLGRRERGFYLMELIFASFLILIIAVGILPIFMRSIQNNVSGGDSSELITHLRTGIESMSFSALNDLHLDDQEPELNATMYLEIPPTVLHSGVRDSSYGGDLILGDEYWVEEDETGVGLGSWQRSVEIWFHPIADVMPGIVTVGADTSGATFETVGHPQLFDAPISVSQAQTEFNNLVRLQMTLESGQRTADGDPVGGPVTAFKEMTVSRVRVF